MNAYLLRTPYKDRVEGLLVLETGDVFHTLERPWINNKNNLSCIPSGSYKTIFLPKSASGKYRKIWHLQAVKNRSGILIHSGNLVSHTRGCLLLGMKRGYLGRQPAVLQSKSAMRKLLKLLGTDPFELTVMGKYNVH